MPLVRSAFLKSCRSKKIAEALRKSGKKQTLKRKFYKIDPYKLDLDKTVVYLYNFDTMAEEGKENNFTSFDPKELSKYNRVPKKTLLYYINEIAAGRKPLLYHFIPHILHKRELSIKDTEIIEVDL